VSAIKTHGKIDGVLGFSQGCAAFRLFMALAQFVNPEPFKNIELPKFCIMFGGSVFLESFIRIKGKLYGHQDFKVPIDSLHIYGKKD
jgi:hypothetical protein